MKIVVFGATGIAGKAVVKEALKEGHEVTVLTRDAEKVTARHERLGQGRWTADKFCLGSQ